MRSRALHSFRKLTASFLALSFMISPLGVLAQTSASSSAASETSSSTSAVPSNSSQDQTVPSAEQPSFSVGGDHSQSKDKPKVGPGGSPISSVSPANEGSQVDVGKNSVKSGYKLEPSVFDGSLQYEIPLTIPPGRNGIEPKLSLQYSSRPTSESNLFGRGWSSSIPYIERRNYMGVDELYSQPTYFSSFDGELASTTATSTFKAKTDNGSFLKYEITTISTTTSTTTANTNSLDLEATSTQYVSIADASQTGLDLTPPLTISMWIKPESAPGGGESRDMVAKYNAGANQRAYRWTYQEGSDCGAGATCMVWGTSTDGAGAPSVATAQWDGGDLAVNTWQHVVLRQTDGTTARMFLNGVDIGAPSGSLNVSIFNATAQFNIGGGNFGNNDGLFDDIRVWSRALSDSEISSLYNNPETFPNGSSLQGFWRFNSAYTDSSANANTLTGNGSPVFSTTVPFANDSLVAVPDSYSYAQTGYANPHAPTSL